MHDISSVIIKERSLSIKFYQELKTYLKKFINTPSLFFYPSLVLVNVILPAFGVIIKYSPLKYSPNVHILLIKMVSKHNPLMLLLGLPIETTVITIIAGKINL